MKFENAGILYAAVIFLGCMKTVSGLNDPPTIALPSKYIFVSEDVAIGSTISTFYATDPDGDDLTFTVRSPVDLINVKYERLDKWKWKCDLILNELLDKDISESTKVLFLTVNDGKEHEVEVKFTMLVTDVNDNPPTFRHLPYQLSINEDEDLNTSIYQFYSYDPDEEQGGIPIYSMEARFEADEKDYNSTFKLDPSTGVVTLIKPLDYEERSFYHYDVSVQDNGDHPCPGPECKCRKEDWRNKKHCDGTVVDFFITIKDVEDTPPVFDRIPYVGNVLEDKPVNYTVLKVTARDGDRGVETASTISYSLSDSTIPFSINDEGEIMVKQDLDADEESLREKGGLYLFNVTATELGSPHPNETSTLVSITVWDVNDNKPEFNSNNFIANVLENTPQGVPLTMTSNIEVTDKDQGTNSLFRIFVETMDGQPDINFSTIPDKDQILQRSSTVTLLVNNSALLDFEHIQTVTFKLVARDVIGIGNDARLGDQESEANVTVTILDTNDNSPVFDEKNTTFEVPEDFSIATTEPFLVFDSTLPPTTTTPAPRETDSPIHHDFFCDITHMSIHIPISLLPNSKLTLKDPVCVLKKVGTNYVLDFKFDECGSSVAYFTDVVYISNEINVHKDLGSFNSPIVLDTDFKIPLKCSLNRTALIEGGFQTVTREPIIEIEDNSDKNKYVLYTLREFKTAAYKEEITDYPVQIPINREIFMELSVNESKAGFGIEIERCYATPTADPKDSTSYTLLAKGCPASAVVHMIPSSTTRRRRFKVQAFHFGGAKNDHDKVYIHCQVHYCTQCETDDECSNRRKRSLGRLSSSFNKPRYTRRARGNERNIAVSLGPIEVL